MAEEKKEVRVEIIEVEVIKPGLKSNQLQDKIANAIIHVENEGYRLVTLAYMGKRDLFSGNVSHPYTAVFRLK